MNHDGERPALEAPDIRLPSSQPWRPSPELRARLLHGVIGVLAASALLVASTSYALAEGPEAGFSPGTLLGFAAIIPQIWVLRAYLGLARETDSDSLRRTALTLIVSGWLLHLVELADPSIIPEDTVNMAMLAILILLYGVLIYCFVPAFKAGGVLAFLAVYACIRLSRALPLMFPVLRQLDPFARYLLLAVGVALLCMLVVWLWYGIALIRLRDRLGPAAAIAGWGNVLGFVVCVGAIVLLILAVVAAFDEPAAAEQELEELLTPQYRFLLILGLVGELVSAGLTVLLFVGARNRGPAEARFAESNWPNAPA